MANVFFDFITLGLLIRKTQWYKSLFLDENHTIYPDILGIVLIMNAILM